MKLQALFKRTLAILLALVLVISTIPAVVFAETDTPGDVAGGEITNGDENQGDTEGVPDEENPDFSDEIIGVPVANLDELVQELANGVEAITITDDILIDRALYITSDVIIYSEESVRLIRDVDYAGDRDHRLVELSDCLPAQAFTREKVN